MQIRSNTITNTMMSNRRILSNTSVRSNTGAMGIMGFKGLMSRSKPIMSDEEFKEKVREIARNDASRGEFMKNGGEFTNLRDAYISVVSPDRHSILAKHPVVLASRSRGRMPQSFDFGVAIFTAQRGWEGSITPAESARLQEISNVYSEAWKNAQSDTGGGSSADIPSANVQGMINTYA